MKIVNDKYTVAVLVPCFNEVGTITKVISDFKKELPSANIYVYDNNSTDGTSEKAIEAGAIVRREPLQGKGNVVRRMFADIDADVYLMVDGDATYDASTAKKLVKTVLSGHDLVNVARDSVAQEAYRKGHRFGNWFLTSLVSFFFGCQTTDMLTGYKGFSRRFVKSFPAISSGFEIETELMIHALEMRVSIMELRASYFERPEGSTSKLSTFKDGWRIVRLIASFVKNEKPLPFFSSGAFFLVILSLLCAYPVFATYIDTGLVPRLPTAILSALLMITAILCFFTGFVLDVVTLNRKETKRLFYLQNSAKAYQDDEIIP